MTREYCILYIIIVISFDFETILYYRPRVYNSHDLNAKRGYYTTLPAIGLPQKYAFWFCKASHKFWERDILLFSVVKLIEIRLSVISTSMICRNTIQYSNTLYGYTILCVRFVHKNKLCSSSY